MIPALLSDPDYSDAFVRAAEAAMMVRDRYQFFVWMQLHLQRFVPHQLVLCRLLAAPGAEAVVRVFNSVPLAAPLLARLPAAGSPLWAGLIERWLRQGRRAIAVALDGGSASADEAGLRAAGFDKLAVHGSVGPGGAPPEVMFVFAALSPDRSAGSRANLELWLPYLQFIALRALVDETARPPSPSAGTLLTERELQILAAVRQARRNAEIGVALGISALTVKNHLRKIMRKLGARNRAQAVAEAMARRLIA